MQSTTTLNGLLTAAAAGLLAVAGCTNPNTAPQSKEPDAHVIGYRDAPPSANTLTPGAPGTPQVNNPTPVPAQPGTNNAGGSSPTEQNTAP